MFKRTDPTRKALAMTALIVGVINAQPAEAQPANDDCRFTCGAFATVVSYGNNPFSTIGATSSLPTEANCGFTNGGHFYNDTWYFFTAACTGPVTVSTCGSTFDTVLAVYTTCPFHTVFVPPDLFCIYDNNLAIACNDDFCGLSSSTTFFATAGNSYTIRIGAYASSESGTGTLSIVGPVCTTPTATISGPPSLSCLCMPVTFTGTADAPSGTFSQYTLEERPLGFGPWTTIDTSTTAVTSGALYTWNDPLITEGYYEIRLTTHDVYGQIAQDFTIIYINRAYDTVDLRKPVVYNAPLGTGIYGGRICFDGTLNDGGCTLNYSVEYGPTPSGPFNPVDPGFPTYPGGVINDPLGTATGDIWNTASGPTAVPDGPWYVRVTGRNSCAQTASVTRQVLIDNTPPIALLSAPIQCSFDRGLVQIRGEVFDVNLSSWVLQYTGGTSHGWTTLIAGTTNMPPNSLLFTWNTAGLQPCPYTIRLIAGDKATVSCITDNSTEYETSIDLGCPTDYNRDGVVNSQDFFDFLSAFFAGCP
jgi:hypothetical protein